MIGNNASGIRTVKYGATKDHILRLAVVLPGGEVIRIGNRARKSSSGYDLIHLFVGSEGTLGLITEATLRLAGLPANFMALRATFPEAKNATDTVFQVMSSGFSPAAMEFLDSNVIGAAQSRPEPHDAGAAYAAHGVQWFQRGRSKKLRWPTSKRSAGRTEAR